MAYTSVWIKGYQFVDYNNQLFLVTPGWEHGHCAMETSSGGKIILIKLSPKP
jgi:hypothetical protein